MNDIKYYMYMYVFSVSRLASPSTPNITSLTSTYSDQLTVTWTSVPTAISYSVSINGSSPISLPANANTYTFTGLANNTVYTVSVVAINCAGNSISATLTNRTSKCANKRSLMLSFKFILNRNFFLNILFTLMHFRTIKQTIK